MGEYTKGPWDINETQIERWKVNISSKYENIACAYHLSGFGIKADEECLANANLIAAAPDLLEACIGLIGILTPKQYSKQFPNIYKKAQQAINKATGKE